MVSDFTTRGLPTKKPKSACSLPGLFVPAERSVRQQVRRPFVLPSSLAPGRTRSTARSISRPPVPGAHSCPRRRSAPVGEHRLGAEHCARWRRREPQDSADRLGDRVVAGEVGEGSGRSTHLRHSRCRRYPSAQPQVKAVLMMIYTTTSEPYVRGRAKRASTVRLVTRITAWVRTVERRGAAPFYGITMASTVCGGAER